MPLNGSVKSDEQLVSYCGLYCGACNKYLNGKCSGCRSKNSILSRCSIKTCNLQNNFKSCADCTIYDDTAVCKKTNSFIFRFIERLFKLNRKRGIEVIRERGYPGFASFMADAGWVSVKEEYKTLKFIERWKAVKKDLSINEVPE
ncbi:MAG: DUF3795 domain-containing protein [Ignavibacteriaceae bacterium]